MEHQFETTISRASSFLDVIAEIEDAPGECHVYVGARVTYVDSPENTSVKAGDGIELTSYEQDEIRDKYLTKRERDNQENGCDDTDVENWANY